jgi:outer membrane protein assembly factor BamB
MVSVRNLTRCFGWSIVPVVLFISCIQPTYSPPEEVEELKVYWHKDTNTIDVPDAPPLVIENSKIVYSGETELVALETNNGEEIWRATLDGSDGLESVVLLYDKKLNRVVSNHYKTFRTWNAETGESIFTLSSEDGILAFRRGRNTLVNDGYGFVGDTLDAYVINTDGSIRFKISADFGTLAVGYGKRIFFLAQAKTVHGALTLGKIRAFDSNLGDSLWVFETDKSGFGISSPIVDEGALYAGTVGNSPENTFVALDVETGELIWEYTNSEILTRSFVIGPKHIYVASVADVHALDKTTGQRVWKFDRETTTLVKPVYLEGYLYHSDHGSLFVINGETGELVHEEPSPGGFLWHIAASSDKIFVQTSSQLIAYQPWHLRDN